MSQKRRQFNPEFKLEALRLASQEGMTATSAAQQLGISVSLIYRWRREAGGAPESAFPGNGVRKADDEKVIRLERENAKLKAQVSFLKKIAGYFASGKN